MHTIEDLEKLVKRVKDEQKNLLRIGADEKKEYGRPKEDTCQRYNVLMVAIDRAYNYLVKDVDYMS